MNGDFDLLILKGKLKELSENISSINASIENCKTELNMLSIGTPNDIDGSQTVWSVINNIKGNVDSIKKSIQQPQATRTDLQVHFPESYTKSYYMSEAFPWSLSYDSILIPDGAKTHILTGINYYIFNKDTMSYTTGKTLPYNINGGCGTILNGIAHIFGGSGGAKKHIAYESGQWRTKADVTDDMTGGGAVVYNGKIYLVPFNRYILEWNQSTDTYLSLAGNRNFFGRYSGIKIYDKYIHIVGGDSHMQKHDMINLQTKTVVGAPDLPVAFHRRSGDYVIHDPNSPNTIQLYIAAEAKGQRNVIYAGSSSSAGAISKGTGTYDNGFMPVGEIAREIYKGLGFAFRNGRVDIPSFVYSFWLPKGCKLYYPSNLYIIGEKTWQDNTKFFTQPADGEIHMLCRASNFGNYAKTIIYEK